MMETQKEIQVVGRRGFLIVAAGILMPIVSSASMRSLSGEWEFRRTLDENTNAVNAAWCEVRVPHDWAVESPSSQGVKDGWKPGVDERWDVWAELKFAEDGRVWLSRTVFVRN